MADRVLIKREVEGGPENGVWYMGQDSAKPMMTCPKCGQANLGPNAPHEIRENGEVHASVICCDDDCDFHAFVTLEGWPAHIRVDRDGRVWQKLAGDAQGLASLNSLFRAMNEEEDDVDN